MNCVQKARRGQTFYLWSVLGGSSYSYIMLYEFRDDGLIGLRLGATAQDLFSSDEDFTTHVHMGCWRINLVLGDAAHTKVSKTRLDTRKA